MVTKKIFLSDLVENSQKAILRRKTTSVLQSPNLIQNITGESAKVKILPPPPKAFRDQPENHKIKTQNGKPSRQQNSLAQQVKELKLEPNSSVPMRRKVKDANIDHSTFSLSR